MNRRDCNDWSGVSKTLEVLFERFVLADIPKGLEQKYDAVTADTKSYFLRFATLYLRLHWAQTSLHCDDADK